MADAHSSKAVALNPNDIFAMLSRGYVLAYLGDPAAGVDQMTKALRYDPHTPYLFYEQCAEASYMLRDYEKAVDIYKRWRNPPLHMYILLAMNYAQLGRMDDALAAKKTFDDNCPEDADFPAYAAMSGCANAKRMPSTGSKAIARSAWRFDSKDAPVDPARAQRPDSTRAQRR